MVVQTIPDYGQREHASPPRQQVDGTGIVNSGSTRRLRSRRNHPLNSLGLQGPPREPAADPVEQPLDLQPPAVASSRGTPLPHLKKVHRCVFGEQGRHARPFKTGGDRRDLSPHLPVHARATGRGARRPGSHQPAAGPRPRLPGAPPPQTNRPRPSGPLDQPRVPASPTPTKPPSRTGDLSTYQKPPRTQGPLASPPSSPRPPPPPPTITHGRRHATA